MWATRAWGQILEGQESLGPPRILSDLQAIAFGVTPFLI